MIKKKKAAIIGASGFTGLELLKILNIHNYIEVEIITSNTYRGLEVSEVFPSCNIKNMVFKATEEVSIGLLGEADVIFLCLPPFESMDFIKKNLLDYYGVIIDIGSDFRLKDPDDFMTWYKKEHLLKNILGDFVYGLPELYSNEIKTSKRIANPGCYPTSVILALAPILKNSSLSIENIIIDSKSGVSGAGRKLKDDYLFCNIDENFFAYSALMHRHIGEIEQEIKRISGRESKICFTPHILPVSRGIFTSIYCSVKDIEVEKIYSVYETFYQKSCFVRFLGGTIPKLKDVTGTNNCQIGINIDKRTGILKIFSVIDNLLKGAAGQAVQNMNLVFKFKEEEGLNGYGIYS